jgi:hypothetical protein
MDFTSTWIRGDDKKVVKHDITKIEPGASRRDVRIMLAREVDSLEDDDFLSSDFEELVDRVWVIKQEDARPPRERKRKRQIELIGKGKGRRP